MIAPTCQRASRAATLLGALVLAASASVGEAAPSKPGPAPPPAEPRPAWVEVVGGPSPINFANVFSAREASLASVGGVPYVAWSEGDGTNTEVRVARLNDAGTLWVQVGDGASPINHDPNRDAAEPSLASVDGIPYVAWSESNGTSWQLRVARLNAAGTAWEEVSADASALNHDSTRDARTPSLAAVGDIPYVAWSEHDGVEWRVRLARMSAAGSGWEEAAGGAGPGGWGVNAKGRAPSLASVDDAPYVAWADSGVIEVAGINADESAWVDVAGYVDDSGLAGSPSLASVAGVPYVAWCEVTPGQNSFPSQIRVARLNAAGDAWVEPVGGVSPVNRVRTRPALEPSMASVGGVPHVAWQESDGANWEVNVARLNAAGSIWKLVGGGPLTINHDPDSDAIAPSLASVGGRPWVAWSENDGVAWRLRVSRSAVGPIWG